MKSLPLASIALILTLSGCSFTSEPTEQELYLEHARYQHCKDFHEEFQEIAKIAETEGGMDKIGPRLRAFGDMWNLYGCNDYPFLNIDFNP